MPLPPGLILNRATGELTGTPTVAGTYVIQLKVRDTLGNEREITDTVVINAYTPMTWGGTFPPLMATRAISGNTLALSGGLAPITYTVAGGSLPAGLSLNAGTGAITGTPSTPGAISCVIRATDGLSQIKDKTLTGTVATNLTLSYSTPKKGVVGYAMSSAATRGGGTAPYTFAVTAGSLPTGMSIDPDTGTVSGTPTAINSGTVTVTVTDAYGFTATGNLQFDITAGLSIGGSFVRSMVGKAGYSRTFTGSGGHTPYVWGAVNLPPGLSLNTSTGVVTGTPTTAGLYASRITMTDALGYQVYHDALVEIAAALQISGSYSATGTRNVVYPDFNPVTTGGYPPRTFTISAGSLPGGLNLDSTNGSITGTPATQGNYSATLRATDQDGSFVTLAFNVEIAGDMSLTGGLNSRGTIGVAYSGDNLGVTGGTAPYSWSISSGSIPPGLSMNTSTGDFSGTPTTAGTYNFTVRATDALGGFVQGSYSVVVAVAPSLSGNLPDAINGVAYSNSLSRAGGHSPYTFDISAGALPTGLSINASTGVISGTPTVLGVASFTVRVTDDVGNVATRADSIDVYSSPVISGTVGNQAELTVAYSDSSLSASGGKPTLAWTISGGTLPPGMSINGGTGSITGTPTTAGTYNFTVRVTDALGRAYDSNQSIIVRQKVVISSGPSQYATRSVSYPAGSSSVANGWSAYTWAISAGSLPPGLALNSGTGSITGTPTTAGNYSFTIRVTDALGAQAFYTTTIYVAVPVSIGESMPDATVGVNFDYAINVSGGWGPYAYSVVAGSLPTGLNLGTGSGGAGRVFGTPGAAGTYNFTVRCTDTLSPGGGSTADLAISIVVYAAPSLTLSYGRGMVGKAYSGTASTSGGKTPYSYALHSGALPNGLALNSSTGALTGTASASGTFSPTIRVTDALGNISLKSASIQIAAAMSILAEYVDGTQGVAYSANVATTGGWSPYTYSVSSGSLPPGLSLGATGTLSGTPSAAGTYNFTVMVTDADGSTTTRANSVDIAAALPPFSMSISPNPIYESAYGGGNFVTVGAAATAYVTGAVGTVSHSWSLVSSSGSSGAFSTAIGGATANFSHYGKFDYERTEVWKCITTTGSGQYAEDLVTITLAINSGL